MQSRRVFVATVIIAALAGAVPIFAGNAMKSDVVNIDSTKAQFMQTATDYRNRRR